jgi:1,4-alpha-glucan branching enzyme
MLKLRWQHPALRGQGFRMLHAHNQDRKPGFHGSMEGEGHEIIVVAHPLTFNWFRHRIGFPGDGEWCEIFTQQSLI